MSEREIDLAGFEAELRRSIEGEVGFDRQSRALYATDASNYRMVPIGVVTPRTKEDVVKAVAIANKFGAPILGRGAGTSLAGQCCNTALVLDLSRHMRGIIELDASRRFARVEPGIILDSLRDHAEEHHLTFGPDPATHRWCTLGGMIGNNSCGVHSIMSGRTSDNIESLEILTYDGLRMRVGPTSDDEYARIQSEGGSPARIYRELRELRDRYADRIRTGFPRLPRRVSGFNLDELLPENGFNVARALVGTEGTCVVILEATTKLIESPPVRVLVAAGFSDIYNAADHIEEIMSFGPVGLEGMDEQFMIDINRKKLYPKEAALFPKGRGWLLIEFGGATVEDAGAKAKQLIERFRISDSEVDARLFTDAAEQRRMWKVREAGLPATASTGTDTENHEGWEDAAVPPAKLGAYLRAFRDLLKRYDYKSALYGHFGHGCVHTRLTFDLRTEAGIAKWRRFLHEAAELVVSFGGSISGEHGDGQAKAELLPIMFGDELVTAFREFKSIWDPKGMMNPGKVVDPFRADENLRLGAKYSPWQPLTVFNFPQDVGSFTHATERCVGAGLCRKEDGGTMCPSYRATQDERYVTRGRARLLFEMMQGDPIEAKWKSEEVKESLDLCLACKACKDECPVQVDMATYKAEFLSHYYTGKLRPRAAYAMGLIHRWAKVGSLAPSLVNAVTQNKVTGSVMKMLGGIAPERTIPKFAKHTFRSWFFKRTSTNAIEGERVLLWADTFNEHFHPEIAIAATQVLESVGCEVVVVKEKICCGRPLYDWGMLDQAKELLAETLRVLEPYLVEGLPIIVLEPSCASVFKDELMDLFATDSRAQKLSAQTYLLAEYLSKFIPKERLPKLQGAAVLHGHCHQKALWKMDAEQEVLAATGLTCNNLDTGCCGMAGAFGFEAKHLEISKRVAEGDVLKKLSALDGSTQIIADGFSCREQVDQLSTRKPLHLAQVLAQGLEDRKS